MWSLYYILGAVGLLGLCATGWHHALGGALILSTIVGFIGCGAHLERSRAARAHRGEEG